MKFGLPDTTIENIQKVFENNAKIDKVIVFGSRAKGNYKEGSDIDLAVKGSNISFDDILQLHGQLDDLNLPYKIDLLDYATIKEKALVEHIDRVGIVFYERWKKYKLGDIVTLNYGKALKEENRVEGKIPVYSSAGITGYHNESIINTKGIIVGRKGTIGKVYLSETPFNCIDTAYYILPKDEKYDFKFLYYLLQTLGLEDLNSDSAVPGLNRDAAYSQEIKLPPVPEQFSIASILSSLDDKINLLQRQNKTLEQLAETLFRQWFVEEADESWEVGKIDDVVSVKGGTTPSTTNAEYWNGNIHWTSPRDLSNNDSIFLFDTERKNFRERIRTNRFRFATCWNSFTFFTGTNWLFKYYRDSGCYQSGIYCYHLR